MKYRLNSILIVKFKYTYMYTHIEAQFAKASDTRAVGHGFKSHPDH